MSSARNAGLEAVKGDFIFFLDGDDWLEKDALRQMLDMLISTESDAVYCGYYKTDGQNMLAKVHCHRPTEETLSSEEATKEMLLDKLGEQACRIIFKAYCWKNVRFPVGMIFEDMFTTFQAIACTKKIVFIDKPFYLYRQLPTSLSHKPNPVKSYHIFKAFELHYDYALQHYPQIAGQCCTLAAMYAISTYFHYCSDAKAELSFCKDDVSSFLYSHKNIIDYTGMSKSREMSIRCFFLSNKLFGVLAKTLQILGLQKKLNLEIK